MFPSNGRGNGLASPSSEAQAAAIRQAYASAGISDFNDTAYLECHGTGTPAGDPAEVNGAGSVFAPTRAAENPLIIGSVRSPQIQDKAPKSADVYLFIR